MSNVVLPDSKLGIPVRQLLIILLVPLLQSCDFMHGVARAVPAPSGFDETLADRLADARSDLKLEVCRVEANGDVLVVVGVGDAWAMLYATPDKFVVGSYWINWTPPLEVLGESVKLQARLIDLLGDVLPATPGFVDWDVEWFRVDAQLATAADRAARDLLSGHRRSTADC